MLGHVLPVVVATLCMLLVIETLRRRREQVDDATIALIFRYAIMFALIHVLAYPVFTHDFWLSIGWGRMIVAGENPYYTGLTAQALNGLPLPALSDRMTYGPLWALISGGLAFIARDNVLAAFLLFKVFIFLCWALTLWLLWRIALQHSRYHAAVTLCLVGWMPVALKLGISDGHNDVVMITPMVLWGYLVARGRVAPGIAAIAASALIKYVTIVLLPLDALRNFTTTRISLARYALTCAAGLLAIVGITAIFARDTHFLEPMLTMQNWVFWTPADALIGFLHGIGLDVPTAWVRLSVVAALLGILGYYLYRYVRSRDLMSFFAVVLAALSVVLFHVVGHVWPWFLLWVLPWAALARDRALGVFVLSLIVVAPVFNLNWIVATDRALVPFFGKITYGLAAIITLVYWLSRRHFFLATKKELHKSAV